MRFVTLFLLFKGEKAIVFNDFDRISNSYKLPNTHPDQVSLLMHALRASFFGNGRCSPTGLCECSLFPPFLYLNTIWTIWSEKGLSIVLNGLNK